MCSNLTSVFIALHLFVSYFLIHSLGGKTFRVSWWPSWRPRMTCSRLRWIRVETYKTRVMRWVWRSSVRDASIPLWFRLLWGGAKKKAMGELIKKMAACVGVFSQSAVNNNKLKDKAGRGLPSYLDIIRQKVYFLFICFFNPAGDIWFFILLFLCRWL